MRVADPRSSMEKHFTTRNTTFPISAVITLGLSRPMRNRKREEGEKGTDGGERESKSDMEKNRWKREMEKNQRDESGLTTG
ncbi:hypothetical protein L484_007951 [Morus notabilis]|uniref:Uncharacterized protein n=1 Tax=Morus notabilis TaxID=981085 RepID=W9S9S5_9ROSA|nr:hypothetical protein L484_007951 [Morus notabilis]